MRHDLTMFALSLGALLSACAAMPSRDDPAPAHVVVRHNPALFVTADGDATDWAGAAPSHPLADENGEESAVSMKLAYAPDEAALFVLIESDEKPTRTDIFIEAGRDLILDRPVQLTFRDEMRAAQDRHNDAATVSASPSDAGHVQEWRIDLSALGLTDDLAGPVLIGFDMEIVDAEGRLRQWGEKSDKWLVDRRLRELALAPQDTVFGAVRGRALWRGDAAAGPPQRILIERPDGVYRRWIDADPGTGAFKAALPAGEYVARILDTRSALSLADETVFDVTPGGSIDIGALQARRPGLEDLESIIPELMRDHDINALGVSFIRNGDVAFEGAFGTYADGAPVDERAVFKMASVAKPVAAMAVLSLAAKGDWSLDAPLAADWTDPDLQDDARARRITTRMALTHTTGLPNHRGGDPLAFDYDPGARQYYSGEGLDYLRRALEARFKKPFQQIAEEEVFTPAGMARSSFRGPKTSAERYVEKFHHEYMFDRPDWTEAAVKGGLLATPQDLTRFMSWMLDGAGLPDTLWAQIITQNDQSLLEDPALTFARFGLGWIVNRDGPLTLSHGGSEFGARAYMVLLPEEGTGLVVVNNATGGGPAIRAIVEATLMADRRLPAIDAALARAEGFEW